MNINLLNTRHCFCFSDHYKDSFVLYNGSGFYLDKESTVELIKYLQHGVDTINWNEITEHNIEAEQRHIREMEQIQYFSNPKKKRTKQKGYIYFIKDNGYMVKIGKTKNPSSRFGEYTKLPFEPIVLNIIESNDTEKDELYYHEIFVDKRKRGEWFELNDNDIKYIKELKNN